MPNITFLQGDATKPLVAGTSIIVHVCNDLGGWGKGFVVAISRRWPAPERDYREWHKNRQSNEFGLGAVQFVQVEPHVWVANMIGQHGIKVSRDGPPIRYEAIEQCLSVVAAKAQQLSASVHMPRIGCGLAGGEWVRIEPIIDQTLCAAGVDVYVYDYGA